MSILLKADDTLRVFYEHGDETMQEHEVADKLRRKGVQFERTEMVTIMQKLIKEKFIDFQQGSTHRREYNRILISERTYYYITLDGRIFIEGGGFKSQIEKERVKAELNEAKLSYDVKNAKRIYKTYWWTFFVSIAGFIIAATLAVLKLIEVSK